MTRTKQEAYDYLRKARYASERKATEDALRPRMVTRAPLDTMAELDAKWAAMLASRTTRDLGERVRRILLEAKDVTDGAIVHGHDD